MSRMGNNRVSETNRPDYDQLLARIKRLERDTVPVGTLMLNMRTTVPDGWIEVSHLASLRYSQRQYPRLAEVIQRVSGSTEPDSTTFALPQMTQISGCNWIIKT